MLFISSGDGISPLTYTFFSNIVYANTGIIQAINNISSEKAIDICSTKEVVPRLCRCTDLVHLQWLHATPSQTLKSVLHTVVRDHIIDYTTGVEVKHMLSKQSKWDYRCGNYLKHTFDVESSGDIVILGTLNEARVAYLLMQHREGLGHRITDKIEVFKQATRVFGEFLKLVFHIKDAKTWIYSSSRGACVFFSSKSIQLRQCRKLVFSSASHTAYGTF